MCENIDKCCRICLDMNSNHVCILNDPTIVLHLKSCLTITISPGDHLPKDICVSCVDQLSQFYNFQLNARCSQDWLESCLQGKCKKTTETKLTVQPLPDSEYNSDSLLEFLNNTENIEEYLNNLGKEDIPSIVNMLDRNEHTNDSVKNMNKTIKQCSPKKKEKTKNLQMEIDVLDSDVEIVKEIILKESDTKLKTNKKDNNPLVCFACKLKFDTIQKLSQHISTCDRSQRNCVQCNILFDSKTKLQQHLLTHNQPFPVTCECGDTFNNKEMLMRHRQNCYADQLQSMGWGYKCKECGDVFKDRFQLYRHAKEHVLKSDQRVCDICGHTFIGSDALLKHRNEDHKKPANVAYKCKVCNETSMDRKEMYQHVKKHTERSEPIRHLCDSCGRSFATRASLSRHCLQHDNHKAKCRICDAKFTSDKDLDIHILEHIELVMCDQCGQNVINYKLKDHKCS